MFFGQCFLCQYFSFSIKKNGNWRIQEKSKNSRIKVIHESRFMWERDQNISCYSLKIYPSMFMRCSIWSGSNWSEWFISSDWSAQLTDSMFLSQHLTVNNHLNFNPFLTQNLQNIVLKSYTVPALFFYL